MISPSQLIIEHLQIAPKGSQNADHSGRCVMCGAPYAAGDLVEPWVPTPSFTDHNDLQNPSGTHLCSACTAVLDRGKDFTQNYTKSVVCKDGLFSFFSNDAVAHWVLTPPEPPYLMFISTQKLGHIVWKAPVNLSRERMLIRYNDKVLSIRRGHLLEAVEAARALSDAKIAADVEKSSQGGKKRRGKPASFIAPLRMDRAMEKTNTGELAEWVDALAAGDPALMRAADTLRSATIGEVWALTHILYAKNPGSELKLRPGQ